MKLLTTLFCTLFAIFGHFTEAAAQTSDDDIISFVASKTVMEDDPNAGTYCFTLYSPDGEWEAQLLYHSSEGMFGTFHTEDFHLQGEGKYYNFVRNPKNDMVFYYFTDISLTVTDEVTAYHISANCLAKNGKRYVMEGSVKALIPTRTVESDLGYAYIVENPFYGTYTFSAENDDYSLAYGIVSQNICGTFYRADILLPELTDKHTGEAIKVASATAVHTSEGDTKHLTIDIISEDLTLYHFTMYNAPLDIDITDEVTVNLGLGCVLQDLRDMYGCYQVAGQNSGFAFALALRPEAFERTPLEWTIDDVFMPYTRLIRTMDDVTTEETIVDIKAVGHTEPHLFTVVADVLCMSGRLYHIAMGVTDDEYMPEPKETVEINFGKVAVVDYSRGIGTIGLGAVSQGKYQLRFCLNTHDLEGEFSTSDIVPEFTDIMVVKKTTYSFHDAWVFKAKAVKGANGRTYIDVNMLATDTVMYHATMYVEALQCMEETDYDLSDAAGATMVALQEGADGDYAEYTLQFQLVPEDQNPILPITDGQVFSFYFAHRGEGIAGTYSYTDGSLAPDERHTFYEGGTEIRVAPVAGTLNIAQKESVNIYFDDLRYATNIYNIEFHLVGQNGVVYNAAGDNFLICIDSDGDLTEVSEPLLDAIQSTLAQRGYDVRKTMKEGRVLISTPRGTYTTAGQRVAGE